MTTIRAFEDDDRQRWEELFRAYIAFYERELDQAAYDRAWREFASGERMHALVAVVDGVVVGLTHFLVHPSTSGPDVCYLQDLFTAPEVRGRGVGRALRRGRRARRLPRLPVAALTVGGQ